MPLRDGRYCSDRQWGITVGSELIPKFEGGFYCGDLCRREWRDYFVLQLHGWDGRKLFFQTHSNGHAGRNRYLPCRVAGGGDDTGAVELTGIGQSSAKT